MEKISPQLLIALYTDPQSALSLTSSQWQSVILVLRHHSLLARFRIVFEQCQILQLLPDYVQHHLSNSMKLAEKQRQQIFYEASKLKNSILLDDIPVVYLKGAAYTLSKLTAGNGRIYSDIDILVDKHNIASMTQKLFVSGWMGKDISPYDQKYYDNWMHEIPPLYHSSRGTNLDIHHNLVPIVSGRSPDISVFTKDVQTTDEGHDYLSPPALLLHSIAHLFFNEDYDNAFRDLIDMDLIIREKGDDEFWQRLLELAQQAGFLFEVKLALRYLTRIFATPLPIEVVQKLQLKNSWRLRLLDFTYSRALLPNHPLVECDFQGMANLTAFLLGHSRKMPVHVLAYHSAHKLYQHLTKLLLGLDPNKQ
ncbi:nucleotidyltransferase family protein [Neiella sp. HB171785]|uniref:Nucleotidyltransferase family protein n=1 Tax=Neiella litorisoli TaxID=2771431 RepID=A0A8J6UMC5_9GAMM|nr:nucleotidyltransferase family protein [Neiella litorisoli]MBD1390525.1 nucleotidyltransferase family protein [Neiella litorisoli]